MSSTTFTETLSTTSTTYGKLRYVPAGHTPGPISQNFGLPAISDFGDERIMPLHDMRPLPTVDQLPTAKEGTAQLLTHGFTAVKHPSIMHSAPYTYASWHNPELLQKIYVTEIGEMLKQITGAKAILTTTLLLPPTLAMATSIQPSKHNPKPPRKPKPQSRPRNKAPHYLSSTSLKLLVSHPSLAAYPPPPKSTLISPLSVPAPTSGFSTLLLLPLTPPLLPLKIVFLLPTCPSTPTTPAPLVPPAGRSTLFGAR